MALYTIKNRNQAFAPIQNYNGNNNWVLNQRTSMGFAPTQSQTQAYNMIGRDAGLQPQDNFWDNPIGNAVNGFGNNIANRARAAENAIGTTIAAPISFIDTARENANIDKRNAQHAKSLDDIYRGAGYNSSSDFWDAKNAAEQELFKKYGFDIDDYWNKREQLWNPNGGNSEELSKLDASREAIKSMMTDEERNRINRFDEIENQLRSQTAANADENRTAANNWRDYMQNSYVGKKINQENGKFLGDALLTLSTGADIASMGMGLPMGIAANAIQGGVEGFANELSQNGGTFDLYADDPSRFFKEGANIKNWDNFDWGRAGQQAASGALAGAATAGLNKVLPGAKAGGLVKNVASSAGRGALSGAVGGAVGAGVSSALSGQDIGTGLQNVIAGAGQGAVSGGVSGAAMGTVNALGNKVIGKGLERAQARQQAGQDATFGDKAFNKIAKIQNTGKRWTDSGENFNERLTNTLNSGESKVGNWINNRQQSKLLNSLGNVGDSIRDYTDQGMGIRKATDEAYKDLVRNAYDEDKGGYEGALEDAKAAGYPNESNYQKAQRFLQGGGMDIYPEDMLESLKSVYGPDFKESTYKNKDGSWKYKNGERYVETIYKNQIAQRMAKDMDAMDAGTYQSAQNIQPKTSSLAKAREIYDDIDAQLSKKAQGLSGVAVSDEDILGNMRLQGYGDEADLIKLSRRNIPEGYMLSAEEVDAINRNTPDLSPEEQKIHNEVLADVKRTPVANGPDHTPDRLAYLRNQIENENISYSELAELQDYAPQILEMGDTELAQWAGIPEEQFVDYQNRAAQRQNPQWDYEWRKSGDEVSSVAGHSFKSPSGKFVIKGGRGYDGEWNFDTSNEVDSLYSGVEHAQLAQNNGKAVVQQVGPYNDNFAVVNSDTGEVMYNGIPYSYNNSLTQQEAAAFAEGYNAQIDARNNAVNSNLRTLDIASKIPGEIEAMNNRPTQNQSDSPTTLGGWVKKAGNRIVEDANNKGVGLNIKKVNNKYPSDINKMVVNRNDMLDADAENPETELYRQLTGNAERSMQSSPMPTTSGDAWDNLAREYGYNTYNDAIRAFASANPDTPISAGAVTTWLDSNEGTYNPNATVATTTENPLEKVFETRPEKAIQKRNRIQSIGQAVENAGDSVSYSEVYDALDPKTAARAQETQAVQKLSKMGVKPRNYKEYAKTSDEINRIVSELADKSNVKVYAPNLATQLAPENLDVNLTDDAAKTYNNYIKQIVADGKTPDEYSAGYLLEKSRWLGEKAERVRGANADDVKQALRAAKWATRDLVSDALEKSGITGENTNELVAQSLRNQGANEDVIKYYTGTGKTGKAPTAGEYVNRSSLFEQARDMGGQIESNRMAKSASKYPAGTMKQVLRSAGLDQLMDVVAKQGIAPITGGAMKLAGKGISAAGNAIAGVQNNTNNNNPQTAVYDLLNRNNTLNVIGRNIGEEMGEKALPVKNYIEQASAESGYMPPLAATTSTAGSLEDLANTGTATTTTPTTLADSLGGETSSRFTGQFSNTGNDQVDLLGRAMELAMAADDADAFATLYGMYNNALSSIEESSSDLSAAQQTQLAKFASADDAINELESLYNQAGGGKGPIAGNLQSVAGDWGWDSGARTYNQMAEGLVNQIAQAIGKTDSLNTEGEVKRALQLVPSLTDDAQTAQNKLRTLREMLAQTKANYYGAYGV